MKLCSDVVFRALSNHAEVKRRGRRHTELTLSGPVFYNMEATGYRNDVVYIGRVGELKAPDKDVSCLIISVGGNVPSAWDTGKSELFIIRECMDILSVFNTVQQLFLNYSDWSESLWRILEETADYGAMINLTVPLFRRWISLTNSKLETVASCYYGNNVPESDPLALNQVVMFADSHQQNTQLRTPFFFSVGNQNAYCINLFNHDEYVGNLAMQAENPGMMAGEQKLFEFFAWFVIKAVKKTLRQNTGKIVSINALFSDLLNCLPVRKSLLQNKIAGLYPEGTLWRCAALEPYPLMKNVPMEYLCAQIESHFQQGYAIPFSPFIAFFFPLAPGDEASCGRPPDVETLLEELGFRAGISYPFSDIAQARGFYRQAVLALQSILEKDQNRQTEYFDAIALSYVLKNGLGEFSPECLAPLELLQLKDSRVFPDEYWNTLKCYLDNEMNASQTARDLFIHRTTFLKRMDKIQSLINLNTPEKRLFIRICMYLLELSGSTSQ